MMPGRNGGSLRLGGPGRWDFSPESGEKLLGIVDEFGAAAAADLAALSTTT
jgi:hypothetical protein